MSDWEDQAACAGMEMRVFFPRTGDDTHGLRAERDLEFLTPECPMCGLSTECDGDGFTCPECDVWWPMNGYGHEARRG